MNATILWADGGRETITGRTTSEIFSRADALGARSLRLNFSTYVERFLKIGGEWIALEWQPIAGSPRSSSVVQS